ncbi:hypothetical protein PISL3812_01069 [Talaromyces islandicus]|uniref:Uncharacterized protein n=1 Tax=Talaromyces islandicus TaxID=28573 RepID=A0A0U1LL02_TALIS|nr:hypothetical protein PISL3812_01069 [Talaromyces islandicus]
MATTTDAIQANQDPTTAAAVASTPSCETTSNGVSKGALAGAIVGSIIGTAILAALAAWVLLRRSKSERRGFQRYEREDESTAAISKSDPSSRFLTAKTNNQNYPDGASENLLLSSRRLSKYTLEPADDESVIGRVLGVFDQVSLHVDNYYSHSQPVASLSSPAETARISAFDTPFLPAPLPALLENAKTRRTTITHALVRSLLLAIQPDSGTRGSLLPPLFTPGVRTLDGNDDQELSQATYTWRILTAYLSRHATPEATEENQARQEAAINAFVENFTSSFAPYADPVHSPEDRARHLRSVTTAAADLGRWLFGQPCAFDFVYSGATANGEVVVLPTIVKVLDERGQRLATKAVLCQATTAKRQGSRSWVLYQWRTTTIGRTSKSEILVLTDGHGVDKVINIAGEMTIVKSAAAAKIRGEISRHQRVHDWSTGISRSLFKSMVIHGVRSVIDKVYPFAKYREAYQRIQIGEHIGKVVIDITY